MFQRLMYVFVCYTIGGFELNLDDALAPGKPVQKVPVV